MAKTTKKSPAKKTAKKSTKKAAPKKSSKKTPPKRSRIKDDARVVAKASGGKFTTDQVRILRVLAKPGAKQELTRDDIKERVGIGRDGKYSSKWLESLWDLEKRVLISISEVEGTRAHLHAVTAKGKKVLKAIEEAHKKLAK